MIPALNEGLLPFYMGFPPLSSPDAGFSGIRALDLLFKSISLRQTSGIFQLPVFWFRGQGLASLSFSDLEPPFFVVQVPP